MSRFTRYRSKARQKKEESQRHLDNFYNNSLKILQLLQSLITRVGKDKWNQLSNEERIKLWNKQYNKTF